MKITPCTYAETMAIFEKAIDDDNKVIHELRKSVRNAEISLDAKKLALRSAEALLDDRMDRYRAFQAKHFQPRAGNDVVEEAMRQQCDDLSREMAKGYEP